MSTAAVEQEGSLLYQLTSLSKAVKIHSKMLESLSILPKAIQQIQENFMGVTSQNPDDSEFSHDMNENEEADDSDDESTSLVHKIMPRKDNIGK